MHSVVHGRMSLPGAHALPWWKSKRGLGWSTKYVYVGAFQFYSPVNRTFMGKITEFRGYV